MKHILITTIAAVLLVGCGPSEAERALFDAADSGNIEAVKQQLAAGTNVNAKDESGWTPLYLAAAGGYKEIAELLIAEGADVHAKDKWDMTPLHLVANKEIAELLIAKGADVNAKDILGVTPLHYAAGYDLKEIVELLIAAGADVNAKIQEGKFKDQTPLDVAIRLKQIENPNLLRKHGGKTGAELKAEGK